MKSLTSPLRPVVALLAVVAGPSIGCSAGALSEGEPVAEASPLTVGEMPVDVDLATLEQRGRLRLSVGSLGAFEVTGAFGRTRRNGVRFWFGDATDGTPTPTMLRFEAGRVEGTVVRGGRHFDVSTRSGRVVAREVPAPVEGRCGSEEAGATGKQASTKRGETAGAATAGATSSVSSAAASAPTIKILVVATDDARALAGSIANLESRADTGAAYAETILVNSKLSGKVDIVGSMEVSVDESKWDSCSDITSYLEGKLKDSASSIAKKRKELKADVVTLVTKNMPGCGGIAITIDASSEKAGFAIPYTNLATTNYTFAHELGHLLGARHDWKVDWTPWTNHGFIHINGSKSFRTVMSYPDKCDDAGVSCPRIPYFSNDAQTYNGVTIGSFWEDNQPSVSGNITSVAGFGESL